MMQQWLDLFVKVTKPVLTPLVYMGINSWLEAFQAEIKDRQQGQVKRVLDSFSINEDIAQKKQVTVTTRKNSPIPPESKKRSEVWPLRLTPQELWHHSSGSSSNSLRIFLAPPKKKLPELSDPDHDRIDLEEAISQSLRGFLRKNYSLSSSSKATEFLSGSWDNRNFHGEASIRALFDVLQSLPTIILHTEIEGSQIAFYLAYWGKNTQNYSYETIFKFNYQNFLEESVQARVENWKPVREQLISLGKSREDLQRLGGNCELNLALVEEREILHKAGIDTEKLTFSYQFDEEDFDYLGQFLSICHCLVTGWVTDIHYLINDDIPPHLANWLPTLAEAFPRAGSSSLETPNANCQFPQAIFQATVSIYQDVLTVLANESSQEVPELALKLAESLMQLPDPSYAIAQIEYSFECWRQQCQLSFPEPVEGLERIYSSLSHKDWQYLRKLQSCLSVFREEKPMASIKKLVDALSQKTAKFSTFGLENQTSFQLHHTVKIVPEKVFSFAINKNGNQLISQRQDNILKLWHLDAGNGHLSPSYELTGHSGKILALAHCDKRQVLASSYATTQRSYIKIWDLSTGKLRRTLFGHKQPIHALAINHGFRSFVASGSHKIKLWDLHTGESWLTLFGHKQKVNCLVLSKDGQVLISGSEDQTIRIWNLQTGDLCTTLRGHQSSVNSVVLSDDGQTLISGSKDKTIKLWDVKTGKLLKSLNGHPGALQVLTLSFGSQYLISGCEAGIINLWQIETGKLVQTFMGHNQAIRALALSSDGQILASSCAAGTVQVWKSS
jgi:WD40 repeat protein